MAIAKVHVCAIQKLKRKIIKRVTQVSIQVSWVLTVNFAIARGCHGFKSMVHGAEVRGLKLKCVHSYPEADTL